MMKEKVTVISNWLMKATLKQKIVLVVCAGLIVGITGLGIYQLVPHNDIKATQAEQENSVNVKAIEDTKTAADKLATTPAETTPVTTTPVAETPAPVVSNTTTVETPPQEYYIANDGAHYESEPVYSEPTTSYSEPAYEAPAVSNEPAAASSGGWNGDLGATPAQLTDNAGDYGTGISN
ncbi:hypothetical protein LNN31_08405 [Acetobacterium wieringae]|uniref:Uncharacterized protein n=1 Tax=Acetobacterium wieringae TaxID=52694 RepID=A0ABY6HIR3_9FIRM|nr:hypothetical protein [Acetobacterium wieringae]UYO64430.1 hypothetical protein LNN31_08405 [Acetobacterium wieringae]VUZ22940.1 Uncharacterised protein [Acetobacterium wieringae]